MNILKAHVSLNVSDVDRSVAFYEKAFGVPATKRRPRYAKFDLEQPALNLSMVEGPRTGVNASALSSTQSNIANTGRGRDKSVRNSSNSDDFTRPGSAEFEEPPSRIHNASHFGIQVQSSSDVAAAKQRFEQAGLQTRSEQNTACCYAVQDKVWIEDPDGNAWEVFVVKADADVMREAATGCCTPNDSTAKGDSTEPSCCR